MSALAALLRCVCLAREGHDSRLHILHRLLTQHVEKLGVRPHEHFAISLVVDDSLLIVLLLLQRYLLCVELCHVHVELFDRLRLCAKGRFIEADAHIEERLVWRFDSVADAIYCVQFVELRLHSFGIVASTNRLS